MMRTVQRRASALLLTLIAASAGCDSEPTEPAGNEAADFVTAIAGLSMASMEPASLTPDRRHEQPCPAGGRLIVEGTSSHEPRDDGSRHTWDTTMTHEDCGMQVRGTVLTANGQMHLSGEAHFGPPENHRAPLLMQESHQVGSMTIVGDGVSHNCSYDLTHTFDRAAGNYRIMGIACGRSVDMRVPLP
jgi:hypothetical protein